MISLIMQNSTESLHSFYIFVGKVSESVVQLISCCMVWNPELFVSGNDMLVFTEFAGSRWA
jgi:hypothetical protein